VSSALFRLIGRPPDLVASILPGFITFALIAFLCNLWAHWYWSQSLRRRGLKHLHPLRNLFIESLQAMNRIAQGDFHVFVSPRAYGPFTELAVSLNRMAQKLDSMEKLRQDFISNVSHEIQSPLTSISGYASLLRQEGISAEQVYRYATIIEAESNRLSKLSDNLLKLSALEADSASFPQEAFRLDKQLENTLLMLEPQWAGKNILPDVSLTKVTFTGIRDLLNQVWINLLHNAIKFTPDNGTIQVILTETPDAVQCVIADDGAGIAEGDCLHIFERFYKADPARNYSAGGSGLGLSLAKKIVDIHHGQISVRSQLGQGSTFTVTLPLPPKS
jgi:signal transduction histidine kinase